MHRFVCYGLCMAYQARDELVNQELTLLEYSIVQGKYFNHQLSMLHFLAMYVCMLVLIKSIVRVLD